MRRAKEFRFWPPCFHAAISIRTGTRRTSTRACWPNPGPTGPSPADAANAASACCAVWHVNWHSMKAMGRGRNTSARADFVLGDLDGAACAPAFTALLRDSLIAMGYSVRLNDPFKGAELVARYSDPARGRHSLQIEINRRLYLDEALVAKTAGFKNLKADMRRLMTVIVGFARENT